VPAWYREQTVAYSDDEVSLSVDAGARPDSGRSASITYKVAIVGSGPAGLGAAAHAARNGISHVLLERAVHPNDTIFKFQKRKHVMATPEFLPLRSDLEFQEGSREALIERWTAMTGELDINIRLGIEVTKITGEQGAFTIGLANGDTLRAEFVVLAIGVQGNLNKLRLPGADLPFVQYQLDDPDEYQGEEIVVIGTGDAGLENALALTANNLVSIVNRVADFPRAKAGNIELVEAAIKRGDIVHLTNSEPKQIEPGFLVLDTADGVARVASDRIIARIGALPPRRFVEACGVAFPNDSPTAFPPLSETYESNVPGLYVIGALAGYPLIKHCLNQGYEVIEYILGNSIPPADEPLIEAKLERAGVRMTPTELVNAIQRQLPIFSSLTNLQIREFLIHSEIHTPQTGEVVFLRGEYSNSLYAILDGEVGVQVEPNQDSQLIRLGRGEFFGEMALISGRRRASTVVATAPSLLLEIARNTMLRLVRSESSVEQAIDRVAVARAITTYIGTHIEEEVLSAVLNTSRVAKLKPNEILIEEGALENEVYLIRKGSVTVSARIGGGDVVLAYLPAGNLVGEMALITHRPRTATVRAVIATEAIRIDGEAFRALLRDSELRHKLEEQLVRRVAEQQQARLQAPERDVIEFFTRYGLGEATDVLVIDESLCVRCDNCEKACAETHQGVSRLNREAGPTFDMLHLPTSCRHCEDPHCMTECPPDAIHRAPNGEVWIDDQCIGCGNCERNCPYGVIQMAAVPTKKPGLLSWLLFGMGPGPGEDKSPEALAKRTGAKHAVKCDMCKDVTGGPACVRACPTGAAIRVEPLQILEVMRRSRS
jgi:CRP-like cAMP-binding protein/thioredoxin reductase/ferredoxin-like protein FixX